MIAVVGAVEICGWPTLCLTDAARVGDLAHIALELFDLVLEEHDTHGL